MTGCARSCEFSVREEIWHSRRYCKVTVARRSRKYGETVGKKCKWGWVERDVVDAAVWANEIN